MTSGTAYVGRFAPSPTGPLHFGSLVAAVASYADARAVGGRWLLRIEDVDAPRCTKAAETAIVRQLSAYGFEADQAIVRQSARGDHYEAALEELKGAGRLFACNCSRKMLALAPRNAVSEVIYPGRCRDLRLTDAEPATALRLCVHDDANAQVIFNDRTLGELSQNVAIEVGDFILRRADGLYAYQLAVVVDDAAQGVTTVVRGEDLLMNTPRQIYLQRCLSYATPGYLHVPLVRNDASEKLSKQTRAQPIAEDSVIATLDAAWAFLHQPALGNFTSVAQFWKRAAELWNPALMRSTGAASRGNLE